MQAFQTVITNEGSNPEDDWSSITAREERKKRQNRLNQRARRLRRGKEKEASSDPQSFKIQRWRVPVPDLKTEHTKSCKQGDESPLRTTAEAEALAKFERVARSYLETRFGVQDRSDTEQLIHPEFETPPWWVDPSRHSPLLFPISPDHILLHLVHFNVFRALTSNKALLNTNSLLIKPVDQGYVPLLPGYKDFCAGVTLLHPRKDKLLPVSLFPTELQRSRAHSSWLNMFPYPRFRDNLIEWEGLFDAADLCQDLFGEIYTNIYYDSPSMLPTSTNGEIGDSNINEDDVAASRRGLIVWREPWDPEGWEITPGFAKKWAWLLEGCEDLITFSNRWRARRGEGPLYWNPEDIQYSLAQRNLNRQRLVRSLSNLRQGDYQPSNVLPS